MAEEQWKTRLRVAQVTVPARASAAPHRAVFRSNETGTWEIYTWDEAADTRRRVTSRANGTAHGAIDASGDWVWWFADADGDELGIWMRQPFDGGPDEPALPGLPPSYRAGLWLGPSGQVVVGGADSGGTSIYLCVPGAAPSVLYTHRDDAHVAAVSADGGLIALGHSEHGDSRHKAIRVLDRDGGIVADLSDGAGRGLGGAWDSPGKGLDGAAFAPLPHDTRLLLTHERRDRAEPLIWDPVSGDIEEICLDLRGEVSAAWFQNGTGLLIAHAYQARDELYRFDLGSGDLVRLDTPRGVIRGAATRPDGSVEFAWSSAADPPVVRSTTGAVVLAPSGEPAPASVPVEDVWVDGPGGRVHALVSRPRTGTGPHPCVFEVHGGPIGYDDDAFDPLVAAWVDHGFAVVQVNYRGSTGYGSQWRDAIEGRPGLTELEDIKAVRDWAVSSSLADPTRLIMNGRSWGGYLVLLGLGTQPDDWTAGISTMPVADYLAAYADEMEALRAYDRSLFGGSPDVVPERYHASSPLTYVENLVAPVLIIAGEHDPRCPIRQITNYTDRLQALGKPHEVYLYDAGHGSLVVEERIRQLSTAITFACSHVSHPDRSRVMSPQITQLEHVLPSVAALNLEFDVAKMVEEVRALQEQQDWRRNRIVSQQGIGHEIMDDWKMLILRGPNGDPERTDPGGAGLASHADTPLLAQCPYLATVLAAIPAPLFSARLMGLGAGAQLHVHRDGKWTFRFGIMRLHIPIITNPGCALVVEDEVYHWEAGRLWYADFDRMHYAKNSGTERRIHLVVDCVPTRELIELFPAAFLKSLAWSEVLLARDEVPLQEFELAAFQVGFPMPATFPEWSDDPEADPYADVAAAIGLQDGRLVLRADNRALFGLVHIGEGEFQLEGWTTERTIVVNRFAPEPTVRFRIREGNVLHETARSIDV